MNIIIFKGDMNMNNNFDNNMYTQNPFEHQEQNYLVPVEIIEETPEPKIPFFKKPLGLTIMCVILSGIVGFAGGTLANNLPISTSGTTNTLKLTTSTTSSSTSSTPTTTVAAVASSASDSVVEITTETVTTGNFLQQYISEGAGSGVIISEDGYIVTNNHVISGANKITVTLKNESTYEASVVGTDKDLDVALLKIKANNLSVATIGDSSKLQVGDLAVAIGNPLGQLGGTVTDGIISALDRDITIDGETMSLLQTSAAINPGNSGGGLFNSSGELIGLVVAKSSGSDVEGLGFAIPINDVKEVVQEISEYGYVRGRIDMEMSLVDVESLQAAMMYRVSQTGVYVSKVGSDSNAAKAGFKSGDCIVSIDSTKVSSSSEVDKALDKHKVGDTVSVVVIRNGISTTLNWTLAEYTPN